MDKVIVSVIVLTYNHEKYLARALDSILEQEVNFEYEIVIGEDKSTDDSRRILLDYQSKYPDRIKLVLHEENIGACRNLFEAHKNCSGKYITLLESDDQWCDKEKLKLQVNFLERNPDYFAVSSALKGLIDNTIVATYPNKRFRGKECKIEHFLKMKAAPGANSMYRNNDRLNEIWKVMCKGPRNMGDFTIALGLLNAGKVFILDRIMSIYYIKNSKKETNYNSIYDWKQKFNNMISILNINAEHYGDRYDLIYWYTYTSSTSLLHAIRNRKIGEYGQLFNKIPEKYRNKIILRMPIIIIKELMKKIERAVLARQ